MRNEEEIFLVGLVNRKITVFDALSMWQELFRRVEEGLNGIKGGNDFYDEK